MSSSLSLIFLKFDTLIIYIINTWTTYLPSLSQYEHLITIIMPSLSQYEHLITIIISSSIAYDTTQNNICIMMKKKQTNKQTKTMKQTSNQKQTHTPHTPTYPNKIMNRNRKNNHLHVNISCVLNENKIPTGAVIRLGNGFQGYLLLAFISHDTIA